MTRTELCQETGMGYFTPWTTEERGDEGMRELKDGVALNTPGDY